MSCLRQAIQQDPEFPRKIGQIVILGGAFFVNGNVNPAAEANVRNFWILSGSELLLIMLRWV